MAVEISYRYPPAAAGTGGDLELQTVNLSGTPVTSATFDGTGQGIPDQYDLEFHVAGAVVTVDVTCAASPKNPYEDTGVAVVADGATVNYGIVPDVGLVVSAAVQEGDQARITLSAYMTALGVVTDILNVGITEGGSSSTQQQITAVNTGDAAASDAQVVPLPGLRWGPAAARAFVLDIDNHSLSTRETLAVSGTHTITFANWGDDAASGKKKADVYVNGTLCIASALFDGETRYEHGVTGYVNASDKLKGLSIILRDTTDDPTATTITLVVDGDSYTWVELAEDLSGSPGTFAAGALTLTETDQNAGIITAGESVDFWARWSPPISATLGAIRLWNLRTRGQSI